MNPPPRVNRVKEDGCKYSSPLNPTSIRLSGRVEAVGYNYAVEPEKGKQLAAAVKWLFYLLNDKLFD